MPQGASNLTIMHFNVTANASHAFQICYPRETGNIYTRLKESTWGAWQKISNYGCNDLASLASALGVASKSYNYYNNASTAQAAGYPDWGFWYKCVMTCRTGPENCTIEMSIRVTNNIELYIRELQRNGQSSDITGWHKVSLTAV